MNKLCVVEINLFVLIFVKGCFYFMKNAYYNQIEFLSILNMSEIQCGKSNRMNSYVWAISGYAPYM